MSNVKSKMLNAKGYTLVELLVVITIMSLLSVTSFVYWKSLSSDRVLLKAIDNIQTLFRTAQSNATSGFSCAGVGGATTWSIRFNLANKNKVDLLCNKIVGSSSTPTIIRSLTLDNVYVYTIKGVGPSCASYVDCNSIVLPADFGSDITISYSPLNGKVQISGGGSCLSTASSLVIKLKKVNDEQAFKCFTISSGGAINAR